jgi:hypothetical protein
MAEQVYSESLQAGRARRVAWFVFWNVLSFAAMFGIFFAVRDVEWWDGAFRACFRFFYQHETLAVMAAIAPFFASLLVGWGYAQRARRRRAREAAAATRLQST